MVPKFLAVLAIVLFFISCNVDNDQAVIFGIETGAVALGYYAAQEPDIDMVLRAIYEQATKGKLSADSINKILQSLDMKDPFERLMVGRILSLAELVGATVVEGTITDATKIPPAYINAIGRGYVQGYDTFVLSEVERGS